MMTTAKPRRRDSGSDALFTTADHGPIRFRTDGVRLWVERD